VDAKEAEKLVSSRKVVILDIRTPEEFKAGHIVGATNINFRASDFESSISTLPKTNAYLVYCAVGGRSTQSLKIFEKHQFPSIHHLDGGIKAWEKAGLAVEK
jgi:rhodanese-related sulfurtransferase